MKNLTIFLVIICMFFKAEILAQEISVPAMKWKIASGMPSVNGMGKALGVAGAVIGMHNNVMVIAGGANFPDSMPWQGGKKKYYNDAYVFKVNGTRVKFKNRFNLPKNIAYSANCSAEMGIVYAGGEDEVGISKKVMLLVWDNTASIFTIKQLPDLPIALTNASAAVIENIIYIAGGESSSSVSDKLLSLDFKNIVLGWKQLQNIPKPVSHAVLIEQSNGHYPCLYLLGGRNKKSNGISELYSSVYAFDIKKNEWDEKKSLPFSLAAGSGMAIGSANILMFGGDKGETFHKTELLIASINAETDEIKKLELIQQKNQVQISHPGFSNDVLLYNTIKDEWLIHGKIPFITPVTTSAVCLDNCVFIPNGEIKPGIRTPQILIGKLGKKR
jgi:cyclically-permuted mutarotase family protein